MNNVGGIIPHYSKYERMSIMNKRIKKKHKPRFNLGLLGLSFFKLEQVLGHGIDHKIKRALINRRLRGYHKESKNTEMFDSTKDRLEKIWMASIKQSFNSMDYYENKPMGDGINE